ncbi:MAG: helix-turn-helix transcriptional regulator [Alistipes sp.]|nr:helix-turn-helix transcriptional regulator [Alistipes sp.]
MKHKLEILRTKYNLSASSLAKTLGVEASAISHIKSGRNKPSYDFVVKILRAFPDVSPDWLLLDQGEILRDGTSAAPLSSKVDDYTDVSLFDHEENIETSESLECAKNDANSIFSNPSKDSKRVERVIVLYSDGSFESYDAVAKR